VIEKMINYGDWTYWIALAHLPQWRSGRINELFISISEDRILSLTEFFELEPGDWKAEFHLTSSECSDLADVRSSLPTLSTLAEDLSNNGFDITPVWSETYPRILKNNLEIKYCPPLLYTKGDKTLMDASTVAIVGSRNASQISLRFTEIVAKRRCENHEVVVSGYAKGVDRFALESVLKYHGRSIVILPQGIMTFASGLKRHAAQVDDGDLLFVSTFHPKTPWSVGLAMSRNAYIYGMAEEIYVAESDSKGGTWSGVIDGLRKGRKIYIRNPGPDEKNANDLLVLGGAIPVDANGRPVEIKKENDLRQKLESVLLKGPLSPKKIRDRLCLDIQTKELSQLLQNIDFIESAKVRKETVFRMKGKGPKQHNLFGDQ